MNSQKNNIISTSIIAYVPPIEIKGTKKLQFTITEEDKNVAARISQLNNILKSDTLDEDEVGDINKMISKKKTELVEKIYRTAHPRAKEELFIHTSDNRWRSKNPNYSASSREKLIEKLYNHYFSHTFKRICLEWVDMRIKHGVKANKTIQEDLSIIKNIFAKEPIYDKQISEIKKKDIKYMYERWTGPGLITRKAFVNRKSVLNLIFTYAAENEYIPINFIPSIGTSELKFKEPKHENKAFYLTERAKLLNYLKSLEQDGYILAIRLYFYITSRVGEIRAIRYADVQGNILHIRHQLVEESEFSVDLTNLTVKKTPRHINEKLPKGNPYYSVRNNILIPEAIEIIQKAHEINPDGEYLFMYNGREINKDTFNERLRKYCNDVGIDYKSSHKLRFTVASAMSAAGVPDLYLQISLGHSNMDMTHHYIDEIVKDFEDIDNQISNALSINR